ncbi:thioesterase II family protein [Streptomyces cellostaticus]|uniref:thioesterase II family protein n=1 Tax=Streptomyces cellostaticus TaxID=67285 RepID=UPI002026C769|nr:alpha/beta fold hydrolase [Streptomyces cellostaticus]
MSSDRAPAGASWIRRNRRCHNPRIRLLCLPHAGGTASFHHSWASWLPDGTDLLSVQYPGRQDRISEPCASTMDDLAPQVAQALQPHLDDDSPLVLFGHSMGAWVAFEVARHLEMSFARRPAGLIVSAQIPPHLPPEREWPGESDDELIAELRRTGGTYTDPMLQPGLRELVLPAVRADFRLVREYSPQRLRRISTPITAFAGVDDAGVPWNRVTEWKDATTGSFASQTFPGGHFYLLEHEREFAHQVNRAIHRMTGTGAAHSHTGQHADD